MRWRAAQEDVKEGTSGIVDGKGKSEGRGQRRTARSVVVVVDL
jgi:hypothetical protein